MKIIPPNRIVFLSALAERKTEKGRNFELQIGYIVIGNRKEAAVLGKLQSFNLSKT